jgi:protoheme ferro-lyase
MESKRKNMKAMLKSIDFRTFQTWRWILIGVSSLMTGIFLVMSLVSTFYSLPMYSSYLTFFALATFVLFFVGFKKRTRLYSAGIIFVFVIGGWMTANAIFLAQDEEHYIPQVTRIDGGDGHAAVIYVTHGEPPGYDPLPWILTMREFDNDNVPFIPWPFRPFFFAASRTEYAKIGGSPHNSLHETYIDNLRRAMPAAVANGTRFYLSFLDYPPHPEEMTVKAINEGASRIIILPVFITESTHTIAAQEMVNAVNPQQYGIEVNYTGALGDSDTLQSVFVDRANNLTVDYAKSDVGVLLIGHGQPDEWEDLYPEQNAQESAYRNGIRDKLIADGFNGDNVKLGWMSFQEPSIATSAAALAANGVDIIIVCSVSLSAKSVHSLVDAPKGIEEANLPSDIVIEYVDQFGDHPLAIQAMAEKITPYL